MALGLLWWKKKKGTKLFLRTKPVDLILCLQNTNEDVYPSMLAKEANCTYSHTVHLLQKMEKMKLVKFEKKGRLKLVKLTDKGNNICNFFKGILKEL
ncbi:MAG: MarR family transcriptional regulator [Candidatus Woesearchaeota archaeon]|nr:MAG: MarR family transcriptional regulator [Candidatus Woesearchaeota archaeon]